jgi:hypothetical protein
MQSAILPDVLGAENAVRACDRRDFLGCQVVAVVCAYNEASRIEEVLRILVSCGYFQEVVVVDDGSVDSTAAVVRQHFPSTRLVCHATNLGKGRAMESAALVAPAADVLFFCDADMRGLTRTMIATVLEPVALGEVDMMIAQRQSAFYRLPFLLAMMPKLGGVRAVRPSLWHRVPNRYKQRFQIEIALNAFSARYGKGFRYAVFAGLTQIVKEKKYGLVAGFAGRMRMCLQVASAMISLLVEMPNNDPRAGYSETSGVRIPRAP